MTDRILSPETCPACGEDVPRDARACPHCGADEKTGWSEEDAVYDGVDMPDETKFNYNEYIGREFCGGKKNSTKQVFWRVAALIALIVFILLSIRFLR